MVEHDWLKDVFLGPNSFLFAAVLWGAWRHRNNMCFSNKIWSISYLSFYIQNMVETFKACFNPISNVASQDRLIKWNNNNHSSIILNVDGSFLGSLIRVRFGGLSRNNEGNYLSGFSGYIHNSSGILQVELLAIYQGLVLWILMSSFAIMIPYIV